MHACHSHVRQGRRFPWYWWSPKVTADTIVTIIQDLGSLSLSRMDAIIGIGHGFISDWRPRRVLSRNPHVTPSRTNVSFVAMAITVGIEREPIILIGAGEMKSRCVVGGHRKRRAGRSPIGRKILAIRHDNPATELRPIETTLPAATAPCVIVSRSEITIGLPAASDMLKLIEVPVTESDVVTRCLAGAAVAVDGRLIAVTASAMAPASVPPVAARIPA